MNRIGLTSDKKPEVVWNEQTQKMDVLIMLCAVPCSSSEMMDAIKAISANSFRRDYLIPLQKDGIIMRTGTGRSTKYVRLDQKK